MHKIVPIKCKNVSCGIEFMPKSERNVFCSRKCFKKDFYHRKKAEELSNLKFPAFTCPECGQKITLDFDPSEDTIRWLKYQCPGCNTLMITVSDSIETQDGSIA